VPLLGNGAMIVILALMLRDVIRDRAEVVTIRKPSPMFDRDIDT
jgi:hypothetical protein